MSGYVVSFSLFEASIGIRNIYNKYYSDIPEDIFAKLLSLDPTSPKGADKTGRYMRWLAREYRKGHFDTYIKNDNFQELKFLREELKLLDTAWLRRKHSPLTNKKMDIFQYSYPKLTNILGEYLKEYLEDIAEKEVDVKYDLLYEDDTWNIFVPLNAETSLYLCGKETGWCTNTQSMYDSWSREGHIFYRFIPKVSNYKKMRLTWRSTGRESNWAFKYSYHSYHLNTYERPFDVREREGNDTIANIHNELVAQIKSIPKEAQKEINNYHEAVSAPMTLTTESLKSTLKNFWNYGRNQTELAERTMKALRLLSVGNDDVELTDNGLKIIVNKEGDIIELDKNGWILMPKGSMLYVDKAKLLDIYNDVLKNSFS